jgi:hypothetical protein
MRCCFLLCALFACHRAERSAIPDASETSSGTAVGGLPTMQTIAPPPNGPRGVTSAKPKESAQVARPPYKGSAQLGPCDDDRGCQIYNHCGTCRALAKGVNLGAIRCDEMVAEDGCAGHRPGCNTTTRTCFVR